MKIRLPARIAVAIGAVIAAGLTACSSTPAPSAPGGGAVIPLLRVGVGYSISTLNETKDINAPAIDVLSLETLMKFGPQGSAEPNLATSVTRPSPVTYVYHLRRGVKFWDGRGLSSADVVYSLNYDRSPGSQLAFSFTSVKSIRAAGPYTVIVTLTHPDASWQYAPAESTAPIFEMKFAEAHKTTFGQPGTLVMGTGPWKVDSFDPTKGAMLSANPHWWGGKVPIQRVSFTFYSTPTSEALAFRAGELDLAPNLSAPKSFASESGAKLLNTPSCNTDFFAMSTQIAPWNDVHVRRAVAYALDRPDIIDAHGGYATPLYTLIPPQLLRTIASSSQISALYRSLPLYPYSLAKARQQLAQSRYPHGFSATILEINDPTGLNEDQAIAGELQKIGINLHIKVLAAAPWDSVESGPAGKRSTTETSAGCFNPDPSAYYDVLGSQNTKPGSWNVADYAPPVVDKLMSAGLAMSSPAQRFAVYSRLLRRLQEDLPYVGLYITDSSVAISPKLTVRGYTFWESAPTSGTPDLFL